MSSSCGSRATERLLTGARKGEPTDPTESAERQPRTTASTSSRSAAIRSGFGASTFSRSSGSVLDARRLNQAPSGRRDGQAVQLVEGRVRERRPDLGDLGRRVGDRRVDLAGGGVPLVLGGELGQRPVLAAQRGQHVHGGQHAGVGEPEVAEVVVRRVLAAEDRVGAGHLGLDERVADPAADRLAAVLGDDLGHRGRGDQVVDDRAARELGQLPYGDQRGDRRGRDRVAVSRR